MLLLASAISDLFVFWNLKWLSSFSCIWESSQFYFTVCILFYLRVCFYRSATQYSATRFTWLHSNSWIVRLRRLELLSKVSKILLKTYTHIHTHTQHIHMFVFSQTNALDKEAFFWQRLLSKMSKYSQGIDHLAFRRRGVCQSHIFLPIWQSLPITEFHLSRASIQQNYNCKFGIR